MTKTRRPFVVVLSLSSRLQVHKMFRAPRLPLPPTNTAAKRVPRLIVRRWLSCYEMNLMKSIQSLSESDPTDK